ncbi:MAG: TraM recognition domain-containing protein, partial [Solirubrobacteraceae bacterium]
IIAQSWSQMREVWGENGVEQLWSAANVKLFGGGVDEEPFLRRLESLLGEYNRATYSPSVSHGGGQRGQRSTSWQLTPTSILTVADLRGLPREQNFPTARRAHPKPTCRGVLFASGMPAVLVRPEYWWLTGWEQDIKESKRRYDRGSGQPPAAVSANPWVAASSGA